VDLQRIAGPVRVEAVGEFPLQVRHVEQGGTFIMVDARAEFAHVGGEVRIENNMGEVTLRDLPSDAEVNVKSNGGPVTLQLRDGSSPDLFINVLDGEVVSDLPLQRHRQGKLTEASRTVAGASQRVSVSAWLGDVRVQREGVQRAERQSDPVNAVPVEDVVERSLSLEPGSRVRVQAMAGDVRVEGADSDKLTVRALRRMWLPSRAGAPEALDSLRVRLERTDDGLLLQTVPTERTEAMGASYYRADLVLSCPRDAALRVDAAEGISDISGLGGPVAVNQQEGRVTASHVKGALSLYAVQGDIAVSDCGGPLEARTGAGRISTDNVLGAQSLEAVGGGIIIKKPGAGVSAECAGGDISLTALGGVAGDYEAHASDGNVRLLLPRTADARMDLTVKNGDIQLPRGVMLAGSVEGGDWRLHGRLAGEGRYRINAGVERGDLELVTFEPDEAEAP
jgi:hypothetical protein